MESKIKINFFLLFIFLVNNSFSKSTLKVLATNQDPNKIRFLSNEGKYIYYQKRSGELLLSSNFKIYEVLKGEKNTQYIIYSSPTKKRLIIEKNNSFQVISNIGKNKEIFIINFGGKTPLFVGKGNSPQLHLDDNWVSYFNSYENIISFKNVNDSKLKFNVKISNKINPFFIPQKEMLNKSSIIYTDLNKKGYSGLIHHNFKKSKSKVLLKSKEQNEKIEFCKNKKYIFVGIFSMDLKSNKSQILYQKIKSEPNKDFKILYQSKTNDIGNIECKYNNDFIYFVKNIKLNKNKDGFEVAKINIKNKKLSIVSDLDFVTQIIAMDGKLLTTKDGEFYLLEGVNNLSSKEFLNQGKK